MERIIELEQIILDMRKAYVKGWATMEDIDIDSLTDDDFVSIYTMLLTKAIKNRDK